MKLGGNLMDMMKQAGKLKAEMEKLRDKAGEKTVEASSGGGMVTVVAKAKGEIVSITIDPETFNDQDTEMLQDLVAAATNEALSRGRDLMKAEITKIAGNMGLPPGLL